MTEPPRRFPSPSRVIEYAESFWVRDASGQTVGWLYFRADPLPNWKNGPNHRPPKYARRGTSPSTCDVLCRRHEQATGEAYRRRGQSAEHPRAHPAVLRRHGSMPA